MFRLIRNYINNEDGATAMEYGLIAALVAVVLITALISLSSSIESNFSKVSTAIENN